MKGHIEKLIESAKGTPKYSRRAFLVSAGIGALGAPLLLRQGLRLAHAAPELFISGCSDREGKHYIGGFDLKGNEHFKIDVDLRCHGTAVHPNIPHRAVVFARRPGNLAYEIDFSAGEVLNRFESAVDRHFYGHGLYSRDGRYLISSENDFEKARGVMVVRDAKSFKVLSEFPSFGIGPHEARLLTDGKTLVIANGGIITHPKTGRKKLNLEQMTPSLCYVDTESGQLQGEFRLSDHKLSIRHLAVGANNQVGVALQYQDYTRAAPGLVAFHDGSQQLRLASAPENVCLRMRGYTASICIEPTSHIAAVTAPRGDAVTFWDTLSGELKHVIRMSDAGGVSLGAGGKMFVISTGRGEIYHVSTKTLRIQNTFQTPGSRWDNHSRLT